MKAIVHLDKRRPEAVPCCALRCMTAPCRQPNAQFAPRNLPVLDVVWVACASGTAFGSATGAKSGASGRGGR